MSNIVQREAATAKPPAAKGKRKAPKGDWELAKAAISPDGHLAKAMALLEKFQRENWPRLDMELVAAISFTQYLNFGEEEYSSHFVDYFAGRLDETFFPEVQLKQKATTIKAA